jgi:drug/metabolite transporter (DMT)-like permease
VPPGQPVGGQPPAPPAPPAAPPAGAPIGTPVGTPVATTDDRPSGGKKAGAIILGIVMILAGALFILGGALVLDTPTCADVFAGIEEPRDDSCFDGTKDDRTIQGILGIVAGALALIGGIAAIRYARRGGNGMKTALGFLIAALIVFGISYAV